MGLVIVFLMGGVDGMYIDIKNMIVLGYLISTNNVVLLDLKNGYNWNLH